MKSAFVISFLAATTLASCDRSPSEPATTRSQPATAESKAARDGQNETAKAPVVVDPDGKFRFPGAARLVAIGDLHGDYQATKAAFRLAGAIDGEGKWAGGELVVVQTGDQLDRGDEEREIIEFLLRLKKEAQDAGGALYVLNGNHETMNVMGDFRYVTPGALHSFDSYTPASPHAEAAPEQFRSRARAFLPGGGAARVLAEQPLVLVVGDTAFAHGGVLPAHVDYGIDRLNAETRAWMLGEATQAPALVMDPDGPLWTRLYGEPVVNSAACNVLARTLGKLGVERMAVGHTVQDKGMSGACGDRVFRIDVGLAAHYGDRKIQVLEIKDGKAKILTAD